MQTSRMHAVDRMHAVCAASGLPGPGAALEMLKGVNLELWSSGLGRLPEAERRAVKAGPSPAAAGRRGWRMPATKPD